ncbi:hypothetical protein AVEN_150181-1 [Araneus ventricosus]|uniref:Gustatory receptor n=1 Tax=Araneus ventricosus TaxID=182803 RepID=A0A4Y2J5Y0_ARAVE|nr:hypothetical protein AVEN_150181-1 [Araneus ventricosus]
MRHPLITVLSFCVLLNYYGRLLSQYNDDLKCINFYVSSNNNTHILQRYFKIFSLIHRLKAVLSVPLFLLLIDGFLILYIGILFRLRHLDRRLNLFYIDLVSKLLTGSLILSSITLYSSRIAEYLMQIKTTAEDLVDQSGGYAFYGKNAPFLLHRIESKNVIHLSACGIVDLKRSFLLAAFGIVLTYGILIHALL